MAPPVSPTHLPTRMRTQRAAHAHAQCLALSLTGRPGRPRQVPASCLLNGAIALPLPCCCREQWRRLPLFAAGLAPLKAALTFSQDGEGSARGAITQSCFFSLFDCLFLLLFYVLAIYKVIAGLVPYCDSAH